MPVWVLFWSKTDIETNTHLRNWLSIHRYSFDVFEDFQKVMLKSKVSMAFVLYWNVFSGCISVPFWRVLLLCSHLHLKFYFHTLLSCYRHHYYDYIMGQILLHTHSFSMRLNKTALLFGSFSCIKGCLAYDCTLVTPLLHLNY